MSSLHEQIQIAFEVQGSVFQRAVIMDIQYDEESIIEGLKSGELVTTTWHDGNDTEAYVEVTRTGERVAQVVSQEIEGEYFDWR
jgi:hypothetical protein